MKLYEAKELIRDVFENAFDKDRYTRFIRNLLKDIEEKTVIDRIQSKDQTEVDTFLSNLDGDAPPCDACGHITVRNGTCYRCLNCGNSMGCS